MQRQRTTARPVMRRGLTQDRATQLGFVPIALVGEAAQAVGSLANLISGNSHRFAGTTYEGAEQARADAGALGAAAGSVQAARYLLSQHKTNTDPFAQQVTAAAIQQVTSVAPQVMAQAQATPLTSADSDQADGTNVLGILWNLKIQLTDPYAGYSTNTGAPGSATAMQLAQQLRQLPPVGSGTLPSVMVTPSVPTTLPPISTGLPTTGLPSGIQATAAQIQQWAQQIASGALDVSQLANLGAQDMQLVQQQVQAIKAGKTPPGGLSVFVANNKPLVYGAGVLILGTVVFVALRPRRRRR